MLRAIISLCLALTLPLSADAWLIQKPSTVDTGKVLLLSSSIGVSLSSSTARYVSVGMSNTPQTSAFNGFMFPISGNIKSILFTTTTQPSGSSSYTVTVLINGSPTSASCVVSSSTAVCSWEGSVSVNAGDQAILEIQPTNNPTASAASATVGFTPNTPGLSILANTAGIGNYSTSSAQCQSLFFRNTPVTCTGSAVTQSQIPDSGTLGDFYVKSVAPGTAGSGKSYAYTARVAGSDTAITTTIADDNTSGSDTSHTASVTEGDNFQIRATPSSTPTASDAAAGVSFAASTTGAYVFSFSSAVNSGDFWGLTQGGSVGGGTENAHRIVTRSQTFLKLRVKFAANAGVGNSWTFTLRVNNTDTALACTVADATNSCTATGSVAVSDNDFVSIGRTTSGSPSSLTDIGVSLLAVR